MVEEADLGKRIQQFRINKGLTLQELAEKTGYTKGYLSKIENTEKAPPVSTLINIAKALNISISEIFGEIEENSPICLVKKFERRIIARDGSVFGYAYETLAHKFHSKKMEPYFLTIPLAPKENALFQHKGEEILFVLEGKMKFYHGEKEFIVEEGDCIYFDGSVPHYGVCEGNREVKCLMVIYTPE
ncbi:MAG: helix-turn-helix domain-containing protein [Deltaproteobacteria bacterium]|nr:helix-turn-helix domain-containing protein [Deltaproteobacteria bacterium]